MGGWGLRVGRADQSRPLRRWGKCAWSLLLSHHRLEAEARTRLDAEAAALHRQMRAAYERKMRAASEEIERAFAPGRARRCCGESRRELAALTLQVSDQRLMRSAVGVIEHKLALRQASMAGSGTGAC